MDIFISTDGHVYWLVADSRDRTDTKPSSFRRSMPLAMKIVGGVETVTCLCGKSMPVEDVNAHVEDDFESHEAIMLMVEPPVSRWPAGASVYIDKFPSMISRMEKSMKAKFVDVWRECD